MKKTNIDNSFGPTFNLVEQGMIKSILFVVAILAATFQTSAQNVTIPEPDFVNTYFVLTSDSTYAELPKESGTVKTKKGIFAQGVDIAQKAGDVGISLGSVVLSTSGSIDGIVKGIEIMDKASKVSGVANALSGLAFAEGKDIVFENGRSPYKMSAGSDVRIVVNNGGNSVNPRDLYRIVRFDAKKKKRKIRWQPITSAMFGTVDAKKIGYANFKGSKYGEQSYLLTVPASEVTPGEYGVFFMNIASATELPVATFSIQ